MFLDRKRAVLFMFKRLLVGVGLVLLIFGATILTLRNRNHRNPARYALAEWRGPANSRSWIGGRQQLTVKYIIIYTTEHDAGRAALLWKDSDVSGHYIITNAGSVWQFVENEDTAFHAGNRKYNNESIAIAVEGYSNPSNFENKPGDCSWQTNEQLESLVNLIKWICDVQQIPIDREHIIGKNQVPGVKTDAFPHGGPEFWGGATNKYAPGSSWNWTKLMSRLGRSEHLQILEIDEKCDITTMPNSRAPIISKLWPGEKIISYDELGDYYLVYVGGSETEQPYLPIGEYHWDGWIPKQSARIVESAARLQVQGNFPNMAKIFIKAPEREDVKHDFLVADGKWFATTGERHLDAHMREWVEIYLPNALAPLKGWLQMQPSNR